jgi:hypothetical protein
MTRFLSHRLFVSIVFAALVISTVALLTVHSEIASAASKGVVSSSLTTSKTVSFHITFAQKFAQITCPVGTASTTFCLSVTGVAEHHQFDGAKFARTAFLTGVLDPSSPACNPASTNGTLTTNDGDTLTFVAHGTYCKDVQIAAYILVITSGTGKFQGASGSGIISVPPFTGPGIGSEIWDGTLTFPVKK